MVPALLCLRHKQAFRSRWLQLCKLAGKGVPGKLSFAVEVLVSIWGQTQLGRQGGFSPEPECCGRDPPGKHASWILLPPLSVLGSIRHIHSQQVLIAQFVVLFWFNAGIFIWTPAVYAHEGLKQHFWHWEQPRSVCFFALLGRTYTYRWPAEVVK